MNSQVELNTISMSKNDSKNTKFVKYDVEASIDEIENNENLSAFKYGFTILSDPKNVRLAIEGIARIEGDASERDDILTKDDNDIPKILTLIYQELFPTFFLLSKSLNVSCPPHMIGAMGSGPVTSTEEVIEETPEQANMTSESSDVIDESSDEIETPDIPQSTV